MFLCRETGIPPVLCEYVSRTRTLHENLILLTIEFSNTPTVPESARYAVDPDLCGAWRVNLKFGFMEDPLVVPALSAACIAHSIPFDQREALYFLGRETMVASDKGRMRASEERIFAFLHRNTATADAFFGLPHRQVVEIGTQIDL